MEAIRTGLAQSTQQSIPNRLRNRKPHPQSMPCRFAAILFVFSCGAGQGLVRGVSRKIRLPGRQFATPELVLYANHGGKRCFSLPAAVCLDRRVEAHFSGAPWQCPEPYLWPKDRRGLAVAQVAPVPVKTPLPYPFGRGCGLEARKVARKDPRSEAVASLIL